LKLRKKTKAVLERKRISKATLCLEKLLKLLKKMKAVLKWNSSTKIYPERWLKPCREE